MTPGKPYRIIFELTFNLEGGGALTLPLTRDGQAAPRRARDRRDGMPQLPKRRTIDLRIGDLVYHRGGWRKLAGVRATRDAWLSSAEARECRQTGYLYRPRKPR